MSGYFTVTDGVKLTLNLNNGSKQGEEQKTSNSTLRDLVLSCLQTQEVNFTLVYTLFMRSIIFTIIIARDSILIFKWGLLFLSIRKKIQLGWSTVTRSRPNSSPRLKKCKREEMESSSSYIKVSFFTSFCLVMGPCVQCEVSLWESGSLYFAEHDL